MFRKRPCVCRLHASTIGHTSLSWPDGDKMRKVRLLYIHDNVRRWWGGHWQRLWGYAIHTMHTDSPFGFFSTPFARCITALFDLVQILLACTVWTRTLPFFSSVSHVSFVITPKHRFGHSHRCLNGSRRFEKFLPPLTSLTVFSAVPDSRKVISRYNAKYFRWYRDTRAYAWEARWSWEM